MIEYWKDLSLENLFYIDEKGIVQEEEWKDIPDYENLYQASNLGRIKSYVKKCWNGFSFIAVRARIMKQTISSNDYLMIGLVKNKKSQKYCVHQLIGMTFLNHIPCRFEVVVDHLLEENKLDNRLCNLQLITNRENSTKGKKNKSGHSCIYKNNKKWLVRLRVNGVKKSIGTYSDINEAIKQRDLFLKSL